MREEYMGASCVPSHPHTLGSGSRERDSAVSSPVSLGSPWNLPVLNNVHTSCCLLLCTSTISQARKPFLDLICFLVSGCQLLEVKKGDIPGRGLAPEPLISHLPGGSILSSSELGMAKFLWDVQTGWPCQELTHQERKRVKIHVMIVFNCLAVVCHACTF